MIISSSIITGLFLVPIILIGLITSYTDIKFGKIKNVHLFLGFSYVILLYAFLAYYSYFVIYQPLNLKYLAELIINGSIAFATGYLLWHFNFWAAGDAKLFSIYSLLIPLEYYSKKYIQYFPSLTLLMDTIFFICMIFIIKMFYEIILSCLGFLINPSSLISLFSKRNDSKFKKTILETGKLLLVFSFFLVILQYVGKKIKILLPSTISNHFLLSLLLLIIQMSILRVLVKNKIFSILIIIGVLFCGLAFILDHQTSFLFTILRMSLLLMLLMGTGMQLINFYIDNREIKKIKLDELRPGSCLTQQSLNDITFKMKEQTPGNSQYQINSDGLNMSQVQEIQKLLKGDEKKGLYIYKTFPFAPFMFIAFIFLIIFNRSFIFFLFHLLGLSI